MSRPEHQAPAEIVRLRIINDECYRLMIYSTMETLRRRNIRQSKSLKTVPDSQLSNTVCPSRNGSNAQVQF